jgi:hypothetical protein
MPWFPVGEVLASLGVISLLLLAIIWMFERPAAGGSDITIIIKRG